MFSWDSNRVFTLELQTSPHDHSKTQQSGAESEGSSLNGWRKHIKAGENCARLTLAEHQHKSSGAEHHILEAGSRMGHHSNAQMVSQRDDGAAPQLCPSLLKVLRLVLPRS